MEAILKYANAIFALAMSILNLFADDATKAEAEAAEGKYDAIVGYINEFMAAIK